MDFRQYTTKEIEDKIKNYSSASDSYIYSIYIKNLKNELRKRKLNDLKTKKTERNSRKEHIIDVIIVSDSKSLKLIESTRTTLESLYKSATEYINFNIIIVEKQKDIYYNEFTIAQTEPFNYNGCLMKGFDRGSSDLVLFCNNDLYFTENWATNLVKAFDEDPDLISASPANKENMETTTGYTIGKEFLGWCFMMRREYVEKHKFNTDVKFWFSDDVVSQELIKNNKKHALIGDSIVYHRTSETLKTLNNRKIWEYTRGQLPVYERSYGKKKWS